MLSLQHSASPALVLKAASQHGPVRINPVPDVLSVQKRDRLRLAAALAIGVAYVQSPHRHPAKRSVHWTGRTQLRASALDDAAAWDPPESELAKAIAELQAKLPLDHAFRDNEGALRRFLIARKLDVEKAFEMLNKHMDWRAANLPVQLTPEVMAELRKGKFYLLPGAKDVHGHPVVVVRSGLFDPKERDLDVCIKAFLYVLERGLSELDEGGKFSIMYDREGFSVGKNFDFDLVKAWAGIASDNYPERLASVALYPSGVVLAGLWKVVQVFFDARTRAKIKMVQSQEELASLIPKEALPARYGGTSTYEFDADSMFGAELISS